MNATKDIINDVLKPHLEFQSLKFACGRQMFCPHCDELLDCRSAVQIDVYRADNNKLQCTKTYCARCADMLLVQRLEESFSQEAGFAVKIEVIDGRDYNEDEEYDPIAVSVGEPVQFKSAGKDRIYDRQGHRIIGLPEWAQFAVYQPNEHTWYANELRSGYAVARGSSQRDAMVLAGRRLRSAGEDKFRAMVASVPVLNPQF